MSLTLKILESNRGGKVPSKYIGKTLTLSNGHRNDVNPKTKQITPIPCEAGEADVVHYDADLRPGVPLSVSFYADLGKWFIRDLRYFAGTWVCEFEVVTN